MTMNPNPNSANIITLVIRISGTIPPTVSRNASIEYVNGKYGEMVWKNFGVVCIGNVPPPPAICKTNKIIATALPGFPNNATDV